MKITALATISAVTGASAQLSKKPLRGGAKDLAEDEPARVLQGSMSMIQGDAQHYWDPKWPAPTTTAEATEAADWSDWKGTSKASKSTTSSKGSKDWWSAAPTVSNAPSAEKEWSAGKSGKTSTKTGKSSSKDWSGGSWKPEPADFFVGFWTGIDSDGSTLRLSITCDDVGEFSKHTHYISSRNLLLSHANNLLFSHHQ